MAKHRGPKKAFAEIVADLKKKPVGEPPDYSRLHPVWRVSLIHRADDPFSWHACTRDALAQVVAFLGEMERLTWAEIDGQTHGHRERHRRHGFIDPSRIADEAQEILLRRDLVDRAQDRLFKFRLAGRPRLWGIREEERFFLLWWDPEHQVYPVERD